MLTRERRAARSDSVRLIVCCACAPLALVEARLTTCPSKRHSRPAAAASGTQSTRHGKPVRSVGGSVARSAGNYVAARATEPSASKTENSQRDLDKFITLLSRVSAAANDRIILLLHRQRTCVKIICVIVCLFFIRSISSLKKNMLPLNFFVDKSDKFVDPNVPLTFPLCTSFGKKGGSGNNHLRLTNNFFLFNPLVSYCHLRWKNN